MEKLEKKIKEAIKKADLGLVYNIDTEESMYDEEYGAYFKFSYQIDDRKDERGMDREVAEAIKKFIGDDECEVSVERMDAYPNGHAHYHVTVDGIMLPVKN